MQLNNSKHLSIVPASRTPHFFAGKMYHVEDYIGTHCLFLSCTVNCTTERLQTESGHHVVSGIVKI